MHDSFVAPFMSAACGVPVTITLDGVARVTLARNSDGLVVQEHDVLSSFTATFESPVALGGTGLSFTNTSPGVARFDYGEGATIGSTAVITLTGLQGPAAGPGSSITAGYQQLTGTVYAFSPEGIPLVDFAGPSAPSTASGPTSWTWCSRSGARRSADPCSRSVDGLWGSRRGSDVGERSVPPRLEHRADDAREPDHRHRVVLGISRL